MFKYFKNKINSFVLKKASANKMIDIVEVRTKEIGLTQVTTETDIRIANSFFLPITILSLSTNLLNRDGLKIGKMSYENPTIIKRKSDEILTTISQISIITSLFQVLSTLLMQDINMRSVGIARVKILWIIFEIPIDDTFIIHPSKLKIVKDETEEERAIRLQKEAIRNEKYEAEKVLRDIERNEKRALRKEEILKRRHKENYIPKEERNASSENIPLVITNDEGENNNDLEIVLDANVINEISDETSDKTITNDDDSSSLNPII